MMNSDSSQQSDNWVQKRVRNLELSQSGRLRHRSEQVNIKPKPEQIATKRNSLPPPIPNRRSSLSKSLDKKQSSDGRPIPPSKARSISPTSTQVTCEPTQTSTATPLEIPEPPVRKSSLTSPSHLIASRMSIFQSKEPTIQDKSATIGRSRLSGKQVTQDSVQTSGGSKSSRLSSPSHSATSSSTAQPSSFKSSTKTRPAVSSKPADAKTSVPAKASGLRTPSKPSVKPKPTASSIVTPTSRSSKPVSRSGSGRSQDGKSFSHSLKPPTATTKPKTEPKVDVKQPPRHKVMNGKSTTSKAGPSQASGLCKSSIDSRSPSPKSVINGKVESPKTTRKFPTNAKSGIPSKPATRSSGKAPVPVKPRPPPKATSKSTDSKSIDSKSANSKSIDSKSTNLKSTVPKSTIPKSTEVRKRNITSKEGTSSRKLTSPTPVIVHYPEPAEVNDLSVCKAFIDNHTQQELAHTESQCNRIPIGTSVNQTGPEDSNKMDKSKVPSDSTADDIDDEIYDDVIHLIDVSKTATLPSVTDSSKHPNEKDSVERGETTTLQTSLPVTTESENVPSIDNTVDDTMISTLAQSAVVHEVPPKNEIISDGRHLLDSKVDDSDIVQSATMEIPVAKPAFSEAEPVVYTADDIYDDVVQNTVISAVATTSHVEPVTLTADDIYDEVVHSNTITGSKKLVTFTSNEVVDPEIPTPDDIYDDVVQSTGSKKLTTSNEVEEPVVPTADDIYDDVLFPAVVQVSHKVSSEGSRHAHSSDVDVAPHEQKKEKVKKFSKSSSPQPQQIKEARLSPQSQYVEETIAEMNYGNVPEMGDTKQREFHNGSDDDNDIEVVELTQSPRQSTVARFQRAVDKDFACRDSGLGIEAYYDKVMTSDAAIEPVFYDEINNREQLETISSTEDVLQTESSTEDADVAPPPLPPRSDTMIEEAQSLPRQLAMESPKLLEVTTVESGFEDQWLDGLNSEEKGASNQSAVEQESLQDNGISPPHLPPRRPRSSLVSLEDKPLIDKDASHRSGSASPQVPALPPRAISSPTLQSPKELASSNSSLAPSHSAVSILSSRSENVTDVGSDASRPSSFVESGGETPSSEHKKEKSKFSLGIFSRKKSDRRKKSAEKKPTENIDETEQIRPRASSLGHSLVRKKSSRQAMKKKGSVPPELEYSLPDPIHIVGDEEYDDCTVIQNNWKSPPAEGHTNTDARTTHVPLNDVGPDTKTVLEVSSLEKNGDIKKSTESLGSFTQNFEDSSGWFDDIYDMVANSSVTDGTPTIAVNNDDEIYDVVAPDLLPNVTKTNGLTVAVSVSPNVNKRVSGESSYDSSGSFDSYDEENEGDELAPLNSELNTSAIKGRTLPQRQSLAKPQSQFRPRSCSYNDEASKIIPISQPKRHIEEIKEDDVMETTLVYADAVFDYVSTEDGDLKFSANDVIEVIDMTRDDWWLGYINEIQGWFPASYVRIRVGQEPEVTVNTGVEEESLPERQRLDSSDGTPSRSARKTVRRASTEGLLDKKLSRPEYRAKIVEEIITTERTYVKYLEDVVEGYKQRCLSYPHLFSQERLEAIFSNISELIVFQRKFLKELESCIEPADMFHSQIGAVFLDHQTEFSVYSEYCNNHPNAVNEMNELQEDPQYVLFFESCRLLRNLGELPLEAFLLKPVQKICKYPLQLSELLKYTDITHPDHSYVEDAVEAMKNVANLINNRKRRIENLPKLAVWQKGIENWKGEHIVDTSSEEIFSGDLHKISKGHSQERHFILFDHQLVYCKREAIGHKLQYRGRIIMDNCEIIDLEDGKETYGGNPVKNAWKINNEKKNKWYILYSKDHSVKDAWMDAFVRERHRVDDDVSSKFNIPNRLRKMAIAQAEKPGAKKEVKTKRAVLQESMEQYKQRSSSVLVNSPNAPKKKNSKKIKKKPSIH